MDEIQPWLRPLKTGFHVPAFPQPARIFRFVEYLSQLFQIVNNSILSNPLIQNGKHRLFWVYLFDK